MREYQSRNLYVGKFCIFVRTIIATVPTPLQTFHYFAFKIFGFGGRSETCHDLATLVDEELGEVPLDVNVYDTFFLSHSRTGRS